MTFMSTAGDYAYGGIGPGTNSSNTLEAHVLGSTSSSVWQLSKGIRNAVGADLGIQGWALFQNFRKRETHSGATVASVNGQAICRNVSTFDETQAWNFGGHLLENATTNDIDAIRFFPNSGNFEAGWYDIYGIATS